MNLLVELNCTYFKNGSQFAVMWKCTVSGGKK